MDVSNPRRILAVSLEADAQHLSRVVKDLTGSAPEPPASPSASIAGTTHDLALKTAYYTAKVPVWLDLIASPADWASSFLSEEAREVLGVLGGLVLVFALPGTANPEPTRAAIRHLGRVVKEGLGGWEWDGVGLAVGVGEGQDVEEWDELCAEAGLEFVHLSAKLPARNDFGEKTGIARVTEALEANDWAQLDDTGLSDFGDFEDPDDKPSEDGKDIDPESLDFGFDKADFEGLKKAIFANSLDDGSLPSEDARMASRPKDETVEGAKTEETAGLKTTADPDPDDEEVAKMERMMSKLQAVREAGEGLSLEQRKRLAARAVGEVMKDL